jgi:hypothetical protein
MLQKLLTPSLSGRRAPCPVHLCGPRNWVHLFLPVYTSNPNASRSTTRFELIVWFVPSLVGDALAVSLVGMLLGPMYPLAMNHAGRVLPRWLLTGSIGWIAGFGQAGSAVLPFMTGAISSKFGIKSLQPL